MTELSQRRGEASTKLPETPPYSFSLDSSCLNSPSEHSPARTPSVTALTSAMSIPGQTSSLSIHNGTIVRTDDGEDFTRRMKLIIVCVGLPARGKSYITKKLQKYLNWMQYETKIFNVGNTRRQSKGKPSDVPILSAKERHQYEESHDSSFFDHSNVSNFQRREQWARETLNHLIDYVMYGTGNVGIFDATNTTRSRRSWIIETINAKAQGQVKVLFLESICTDPDILEKNIRLKLSGPDYKDTDPQVALQDFRNRLANYEQVYETIDDEEEQENERFDIQYVKIINAGKKISSYNISGYLSSHTVFFLLNFNLAERQIWLTPSGECEYNVENRKGGDSPLTKKGEKFSRALAKFVSKKRQEFKLKQLNKEFIQNSDSNFPNHLPSAAQTDPEFNLWSSMTHRALQTASHFPATQYLVKSFRMLNDLGCGNFEGTTEREFKHNYPREYENQMQNRLSYRFPGLGGESYLDVISRLRPIIIELERLKDHVLIISHRVITRVLLGYFMNLSKEMLTELDVQQGYVYCVEPKPYGLDLKIWHYDDVSDDFFEVDEIEFMKRKRNRTASISISQRGDVVIKQDPRKSQSSTGSRPHFTINSDDDGAIESDTDEDEEEESSSVETSGTSSPVTAQVPGRIPSLSHSLYVDGLVSRLESELATPVTELDQRDEEFVQKLKALLVDQKQSTT
ncbi:unnamed protein product [Kuraishia capsulata CBS 1993]|uniref:6-phosphofructo-2-kinase domain-containing protein n=1 Tax=Kuraishia capsulata CBS 1993 TaxID=1382522 RepID=W6MQ88_9ASCO|nr:uncharacterized protein KUCA_T00004836001 [Kuraishia capsulata CBS 1993]CDK28851.1 unnamed protein product [Kuraishia capsulata CBS 1993]